MKKHYLVYQITNLVNDKIYIGIHGTDDLEDGYMGSGGYLWRAIKKHGIENFRKEILFEYDNPDEMIAKERELVDRKFIARKDTYNLALGGRVPKTVDNVTVRDKDGNCFNVHRTDERYLSGELQSVAKGLIVVRNEDGTCMAIQTNDPRYISGELKSASCGRLNVKDANGKILNVLIDDPRYKSGELIPISSGNVTVKDQIGNLFRVSVDDPRFLSGELVGMWKGCKHSEKTKKQIGSKSKLHQKGSGNSQFGTCWIHKLDLKENKKIKKEELDSFLSEGWIKGRKMKF